MWSIVTLTVLRVEEPSVQVALESVQVVGGAAADVTVRPDELVRGHDRAKQELISERMATRLGHQQRER